MNRIKRLILKDILPHLYYGILYWGFSSSRTSKLQKKSVRIIIGAKHNAHTDLLFKDLTLSKVTDISILQ